MVYFSMIIPARIGRTALSFARRYYAVNCRYAAGAAPAELSACIGQAFIAADQGCSFDADDGGFSIAADRARRFSMPLSPRITEQLYRERTCHFDD